MKSNNKFWRLSPAVRALIGVLALGAALTAGFAACSDDSDDSYPAALVGKWQRDDDETKTIEFTNEGIFTSEEGFTGTYTATGTTSGNITVKVNGNTQTGKWSVSDDGTQLTLTESGEEQWIYTKVE